jgi:hypothetical protein
VIERTVLHDQLVVFMQQEHRGGFLLVDPLTVCTIGFWEHPLLWDTLQARLRKAR